MRALEDAGAASPTVDPRRAKGGETIPMIGDEAVAREHRRDLKLLFIPGCTGNTAMANAFLGPGMEMVMRPFAIDISAIRIRDAIAARTALSFTAP